MIKIKLLVENWMKNEYDMQTITEEYKKLHNALCALYENGLIDKEKMQISLKKLNKAYELISIRLTGNNSINYI